nr:MAG TPA: hypothetical protein [Caudoviricetes sp.]
MNKCKYKINIKDIQDRYKFKVFMRSGADIPKLITDDISSIKKAQENQNNINKQKVDKIEGKVLSSNDFTNQYKEKLENLQNYDDSSLNKKIKDLEEKINEILRKKYKYVETPVISNFVGTGYIDNNYNINENISYIFRHKCKCIQGDKISLRTNTNLNFFAIIYYTKNNDAIYGEKSSSTTEIQNFIAPENTDYAIIISYFKENFVEYSSLKIMRKVQIIEGE